MLGDCTEKMALIESQSVDCVITDPPYPEIDRQYGRMTEAEWWDMIMIVCAETRRILKPTGSAVFILQPNSRKVGSMRGWLWRFMWWVTEEWNMVQDAWWWNTKTFPTIHPLRPSLKACVWAGQSDCFKNQSAVLWRETQANAAARMTARWGFKYNPSGSHNNTLRASLKAIERGGVTPYNVLPMASDNSAKDHGHGAATPMEICAWWTRYICPPGGVVCDPFAGSGTMGLAALAYGCQFIGIEKLDASGYYPTAATRLAEAALQPALPFSTTPSNTTSSRPPELAGLWDQAEDETVAVNRAAADVNR
jgi:site-specific DNA-methyltransferase (adenine-specific)